LKNQQNLIYERNGNLVYSREFGSDPSSRELAFIIGDNTTSDYDRFDKIVKQIMAASDANLQVQ
jgi:hypothetical protein